MAGRVFISHASADRDLANSVCRFLEERGISCWIAPRDMPPGPWGEGLYAAIADSLAIILILSEYVNQSEAVEDEIFIAKEKRKPIFPLKLGPVTLKSELAFRIGRMHWLDLTLISADEAFLKLQESLQTLVIEPGPSPAPEPHGEPGLLRDDLFQQPTAVMVLEASRHEHENILHLSAYERALDEVSPLRHYDKQPVSFTDIQQEIDNLLTLLDRAAHSAEGILDVETWHAIRAHGEKLYTQLFPPSIQQTLTTSRTTDLLLDLTDTLVHIPWELLFDGEHFLCRRFSIGRSVSTAQAIARSTPRKPVHPLKMLVVADPQGNLPAAAREGKTLQQELTAERQHFRVEMRRHPVPLTALISALAQCDVLHYAGHATYNADQVEQSGWLLADGRLTAAQVGQFRECSAMPALVFCNACQSGLTTAWQIEQTVGHAIYGLANAFLVAGTQHYIGTLWNIPDEPSAIFAIEFYRALARGATIGWALRRARQRLITHYGADSVVWASYVLYGDPTSHYLETPSEQPSMSAPPVVQPEIEGIGSHAKQLWRRGMVALACLVVALGVWWGRGQWMQQTSPTTAPPSVVSRHLSPGLAPLTVAYTTLAQGEHQKAQDLFQTLVAQPAPDARSQGFVGLAAVAWARGETQQVEALARQAEEVDPQIVYSHVLRGNLFLQQGKTAEATAAYRTAIARAHGSPWQFAMAYNRLGRLYAARGALQPALEQYDKALSQPTNDHQERAVVFANRGHALVTLGRYKEALQDFQQAMQLAPDDRLTPALLREAERREQHAQDREQQERIDKLVADLLQRQREGGGPAASDDAWTSRPLRLAFPPIQSQGTPSLRAGEEDVLLFRLGEALQAHGIPIVERAVLDKLLAELKLSTSALVQREAAVQVGQILAARVIAIGSLTRNDTETRLSLRLVDTETSAIQAMISTSLQAPLEREGIADPLVATLVQKLRTAYPLQGRIIEIIDDEVILNIGTAHGVTAGLTLQVFGEEATSSAEGRTPQTRRRRVGTIQVANVEDEQHSHAKVLQQTATFALGWKVREK